VYLLNSWLQFLNEWKIENTGFLVHRVYVYWWFIMTFACTLVVDVRVQSTADRTQSDGDQTDAARLVQSSVWRLRGLLHEQFTISENVIRPFFELLLVLGSIPGEEHLSLYVTSHPCQLSLAIPSWVGAMSTSQRAVMPCGWCVKAGMVRVWVAGKTVWSPCYTRAVSERFRDKELIIKRYINSPSLLYFTFAVQHI